MKAAKNTGNVPGGEVKSSHWMALSLVLVAVSGSAIGVVMTTFSSRHLLNDLHRLEQDRNAIQVEWGRLLLEQSSLVSQGKVEDTALANLGMEVPVMDQVVVLTSE